MPLLGIPLNIRARHDPHPIHSVFDTHLFVFVTEAIRIRICIRDYPFLNPNPIKIWKQIWYRQYPSVSDLFTSLAALVCAMVRITEMLARKGIRAIPHAVYYWDVIKCRSFNTERLKKYVTCNLQPIYNQTWSLGLKARDR